MVEQLFGTPGAGQDVSIFSYASDVDADQRMEIDRMGAMLKATRNKLSRSKGVRTGSDESLEVII